MDDEKRPLTISVDDEEYCSDGLPSPSLPPHSRAIRKMRRAFIKGQHAIASQSSLGSHGQTLTLLSAVTSRRYILLGGALAFLFFILSRSSVSPLPAIAASRYFACDPARHNPHSIRPPPPLDAEYTASLWRTLQDIFDGNVPTPAHLDQPHHIPDLGFPPKDKLGSFFNLSADEAKASRATHARVLTALPPYPAANGDAEPPFKGRGIVMLAGARYSEFAATSLGMLRESGSKLPVEVWARDEAEETPGWCAELAGEGIACRRLVDHVDISALKHPYQWKVFTLLFSSFREVLFLDADDMPVRDPDDVFESEAYRQQGTILWPDYWKHSGSPWLPYIIGTNEEKSDMYMDEKSVESGQIVWDKERHWKVRSPRSPMHHGRECRS